MRKSYVILYSIVLRSVSCDGIYREKRTSERNVWIIHEHGEARFSREITRKWRSVSRGHIVLNFNCLPVRERIRRPKTRTLSLCRN